MKQLKNQRGLTLVELLAVVVILAIIAAIAAVAIGNVINNSKDKAILSDAVMVIEGAKLANIEGACDAKDDGTIDCSAAGALKPFVSGVSEDLDEYKPKFTAEADGGGEWEVTIPKYDKIKNQKYRPAAKTATESEIKNALDGKGKTPSTP